jgi:hypothetical protein
MRKNPRGDTTAGAIPRPQQEKMPCGIQVHDQLSHTLDAIGGHQALPRKNIFELGVKIIGEVQTMRFFDQYPLLLRLSDAPPTGARQVQEKVTFVPSEVNFKSMIQPIPDTAPTKIPHRQIPVHYLKMHTPKFLKSELNQSLHHLLPVRLNEKGKAHIIGAPSRERAAEYPEAEFSYDYPDKISDRVWTIFHGSNNRLALLSP